MFLSKKVLPLQYKQTIKTIYSMIANILSAYEKCHEVHDEVQQSIENFRNALRDLILARVQEDGVQIVPDCTLLVEMQNASEPIIVEWIDVVDNGEDEDEPEYDIFFKDADSDDEFEYTLDDVMPDYLDAIFNLVSRDCEKYMTELTE